MMQGIASAERREMRSAIRRKLDTNLTPARAASDGPQGLPSTANVDLREAAGYVVQPSASAAFGPANLHQTPSPTR